MANFLANLVNGQQYYYIAFIADGDDKLGSAIYGYKNRVRSGILIRTTPQTCVLDVTDKNIEELYPTRWKTEKEVEIDLTAVYETEKECWAILMKMIDDTCRFHFNATIFELAQEYQELLEQHPEKFI